ncbi:MAG TPA: tRNA pseudouridine(38-40) synthase TruA [Polyangiaceae bacterium]|jgi:tRNA pseudouridine38-40 synthase|nr:tRNA pseudouridine(38-40) synthase TruA [Polyangiaceae bacterium]
MDPETRFGVLLTVAYDGAAFSGFARQPSARTVAGELDGAVRAIDPTASLVRGASRTDAGVHALSQRVAFDTRLDIPPRGWTLSLARHLSSEIAIVGAARVPPDYDPRSHSVRKLYRYRLLRSPVRDPLLRQRAWRLDERLNHVAMCAEAAALLGSHDFRAFRTSTDERTDTVRTIFRADLVEDTFDSRMLCVEIEGDRFLHRMVRIIVGTIVDVGRGRLEPGAICRGLTTGDRRVLGITAPPDGLYLATLELDDDGADKWPDHLSVR